MLCSAKYVNLSLNISNVPFIQFVSECSTLLKFLGNQINVEFTGKNFVVSSAKSKEFD